MNKGDVHSLRWWYSVLEHISEDCYFRSVATADVRGIRGKTQARLLDMIASETVGHVT